MKVKICKGELGKKSVGIKGGDIGDEDVYLSIYIYIYTYVCVRVRACVCVYR